MDELIEKISPVCYEAIRAWQIMNGETPVSHWYSTTKETRDLMREMVKVSLKTKCPESQFDFWIGTYSDRIISHCGGIEKTLFVSKDRNSNKFNSLPSWQKKKFELITCISECLSVSDE